MVSQDFETTIAYRAVSSQRGSTPRLCLGHGRGRGAAGGQLGPLGVVEPILDVLHQLSLDAFQHCLLRRRYLPDGVNLLHARKAEGHLRGEEGHARASVGLEKAELVCLLTGQARQHGITEPPSGIGLRKRRALSSRGGACAGVFCAQLLHGLQECRPPGLRDPGGRGVLREERQRRGTVRVPRMAAHNRHPDQLGRNACLLGSELVRPQHIQGRDAAYFERVQAALLVEFGHGRHYGRHRVDDEAHNGIRAELRTRLHYALDHATVILDELFFLLALNGHSDAGQDQVAASQALLQVVNFLLDRRQGVCLDAAAALDVIEVFGDALRRKHRNGPIIHSELANKGVKCREHAP
mmetsp:Transcript_72518/g.235571  ORF Transcript_72518/g.235571 Transcript_72518/m.235571 type:complete len:353 (-) Transcript_72518:213-1271(-)